MTIVKRFAVCVFSNSSVTLLDSFSLKASYGFARKVLITIE